MRFDHFKKPIASLYRARIYFILGLLLLMANTILAPYFTNKTLSWYEELIKKGIGGLDEAAYVFLLAGVIYAILCDLTDFIWTSRVKDELREGFREVAQTISTGVNEMTDKAVTNWIRRGTAEPSIYKNVGKCAFEAYYGDHIKKDESHFNFIVENMLEKYSNEYSVTRENYRDNIVIRTNPGNDTLLWEEEKKYTLVCLAGTGEHQIRGFTSCRADPRMTETILKNANLLIDFDEIRIFSFRHWFEQNKNILSSLESTGHFADQLGNTIVYDGNWLTMSFQVTVKISKIRTPVRIFEVSNMDINERCLHLILEQPTFRLNFSMRLEGAEDWSLMKPLVGAEFYHGEATDFVKTDLNNPRWVSVDVPKWILPGLALVAEWTAPRPQKGP